MKRLSILRIGKYLLPVFLGTAAVFIWRNCSAKESQSQGSPRDYEAIVREGTIRVATEYNSVGFHVQGDTLAGFHYDLIQAFAREKGLKAEITPMMTFGERLEGLERGRYDLIAYDIPSTNELKDSILLTHPVLLSKQVLVQRRALKDSTGIRSQLDLAGRTVYVVKGAPSIFRIRNLAGEIGDTIYIKEIEKYGPEQLISLVAHGEIDYAVCDETLAQAAADSLPQIDIDTPVSFTLFYSWGVSKQSPALLDTLNVWIDRFRESEAYRQIHRKYF